MQDRFKFNAVVSSYYDIDTPEEYKEVEPQFYLKNVDVFCTGEIGIDYDRLLETVKEQAKYLTEKEIGQIMQHFEDNSNSPECDFVTITPDKIIQSTDLKDKNGKLIYENDIVKFYFDNDEIIAVLIWDNDESSFYLNTTDYFKDKYVTDYEITKQEKYEVIGNIYENPELIGGRNEKINT